MSHRRAAQLGLLAATAVLVASMGILISQGSETASAGGSPSAAVNSFAAQAAGIPSLLSAASHLTPNAQH